MSATKLLRRFGLNLDVVHCPQCHAKMPTLRLPDSLRQALHGGWTCEQCGCRMDKWGEPLAAGGESNSATPRR